MKSLLFLSMLLFISILSFSQEGIKIADETTYKVQKTAVKITTSNDSIHRRIFNDHRLLNPLKTTSMSTRSAILLILSTLSVFSLGYLVAMLHSGQLEVIWPVFLSLISVYTFTITFTISNDQDK